MTALPTTNAPNLAPVPDLLPDDAEPAVEQWTVVQTPAARAEADVVRVLLVEELEQVAQRVTNLLAPEKRVRLIATVADGSEAVERIAAERPDVIIVDALLQGQLSGLDVARAVRAAGLSSPVIFLTVPDRPVKVPEDLGQADVISMPIDGHALLTTIRGAAAEHRDAQPRPPAGTVAVFSAKGGVGRTAIAHNLAVAMGRTAGSRVVLVDGDQVHGDLRLHLEAPDDAPSLVQLPTGHTTEADVTPLLWQDATGLDVLLAPPRMEEADLIMTADVQRAHHVLKHLYDLIVIDVPANMDDRTLAMLDDADVVLDVTTPRHGAVRKTQRCHAVLAAAGFPMHKVVTVVNHADPSYDEHEFSAELGWRPDAVLMHDDRLATGAVAPGSSIVATHPDSLFSRGFNDLAELLTERLPAAEAPLAAQAA
ncbi:MAG: response regulator [Candidatus Limnocylindrales bacterium]